MSNEMQAFLVIMAFLLCVIAGIVHLVRKPKPKPEVSLLDYYNHEIRAGARQLFLAKMEEEQAIATRTMLALRLQRLADELDRLTTAVEGDRA